MAIASSLHHLSGSRVDPVFNDIHNGIKKSEDPAFRLTMLQALGGVIQAGGQRMNEKHRGEIQG